MKRPRLRRLWLIPLGALLLLPLAWALVVLIAPTDWAREQIVARVSAATGRAVRLHSLKVGLCGGIFLEDLEIAAPREGDAPWLKVAGARINVHVLQLLTGHVEPSEIRVDGATLRVLRRKDGSLELSDLLQPPSPPKAAPAADANPGATDLAGLEVVIRDARISAIDEPTQTRLEFSGVEGRAIWSGPRITITKLEGSLNGGPLELAAHLDRSGPAPEFEGQIRTHDVTLTEGMTALGYLVPVLAGTSDGSLQGKLTLDVYVRGQGQSVEALKKTLVGQGSIGLDPIQLDGSQLLAELARLADQSLPGQGRVGAVKSDFTIKDGRITTDDLTVSVGRVPLVLRGWTDFGGQLDYTLKTDGLTDRLPGKARNLLSELDVDLKDLTTLRVRGSVDALVVTLDGVPLNEAPAAGQPLATKGDERQRYREIGRRLRDKILR